MIVLAIAGLIIGIVFLASPAILKRGRNTQRTADIGLLEGTISTFSADNNGALPERVTGTPPDDSQITGLTADGTGSKLGYYTEGAKWADKGTPITKALALAAAKTIQYYPKITSTEAVALDKLPIPDAVYVLVGVKCGADKLAEGSPDNENPGDFDAADIKPGTSRSYAIVYQIEGEAKASCRDNA